MFSMRLRMQTFTSVVNVIPGMNFIIHNCPKEFHWVTILHKSYEDQLIFCES